jgi:hypothetical protein
VVVRIPPAGAMPPPAALSPRDGMLVARLLAVLPDAFSRWLDGALAGASPDAALLSLWRRDLARVARAAEGALARTLSDGVDAFAIDGTTPFAWPQTA